MPSVQEVLQEKRINFVNFLKQIAQNEGLTKCENYIQYTDKVENASIDEFIYYIANYIQPHYVKGDLDKFITELGALLFGIEFNLKQNDAHKIQRYLELFVKLVNN